MALLVEELHRARAEVMYAGQHVHGMFLWVFIKAWEIQERYWRNKFKDDPLLIGRLVIHMLVHDGEQTFKTQLEKIGDNKECIIALQAKVNGNHKETIGNWKKLKYILEGMDPVI